VARLGEDGRRARVGAGLSLRFVASAIATSHGRVARFERGDVRSIATDFLGAYCTVVGLDLGLRGYPAGDPLRDRAHSALLARFRRELPDNMRWRTEVPLPLQRDLRAWDAVIDGPGWQVHVEAETRLDDGQALERKLALKHRDGGGGQLLLLVSETRANRAALAALGSLRSLLPLDTREVLGALRAGRRPAGSGIVVL
jgi:transcriptional regulator with XRE-family HTH domain